MGSGIKVRVVLDFRGSRSMLVKYKSHTKIKKFFLLIILCAEFGPLYTCNKGRNFTIVTRGPMISSCACRK